MEHIASPRLASFDETIKPDVLKALADGTRLEIVAALLTRSKPVPQTYLLSYLLKRGVKLQQPNVSHHVNILKRANLVTIENDGKRVW